MKFRVGRLQSKVKACLQTVFMKFVMMREIVRDDNMHAKLERFLFDVKALFIK